MLSLKELCLESLLEQRDTLRDLGAAPYSLLKPILRRCTYEQLAKIEKCNPNICRDSDELWLDMCRNEFPTRFPGFQVHTDSWRQYYYYCLDEREKKLQSITANIMHNNKSKTIRMVEEIRDHETKPLKIPKSIEKHKRVAPNKKKKLAPLMRKCITIHKHNQRR